MTVPATTDDHASVAPDPHASVALDRTRSRERAVRRVFSGFVTATAGWVATMATTPILEAIFGASQRFQEIWSIGARSLVWVGVLIAATAGTHLLRFGGRRGVLAFVSFAAAGACGLVAVAEQFETWFLTTRILSRFDELALYTATALIVLGIWLLRGDQARGVDE